MRSAAPVVRNRSFYHVRLHARSADADRLEIVRLGLTHARLMHDIVTPYQAGEPVRMAGQVVPVRYVERIQVTRTTEPMAALLARVRGNLPGDEIEDNLLSMVAAQGADVSQNYFPNTLSSNLAPSAEKSRAMEGPTSDGDRTKSDKQLGENLLYKSYVGTWVDLLYDRLHLSIPTAAVLIGLTPFVLCLLVSLRIGFASTYLRTVPVYVGTVALAAFAAVARYGSSRLPPAYRELRQCFLESEEAYERTMNRYFSFLKSRILVLPATIILLFASQGAVILSIYHNQFIHTHHLVSLRPPSFSASWYSSDYQDVKAGMLAFWGTLMAIAMGTSYTWQIVNYVALISINRWKVIPLTHVLRIYLRSLSNLYITVSFFYLGVVLNWTIIWSGAVDWISLFILLFSVIVGVLTFAVPQFIFRGFLMRSHRLACEAALRRYTEVFADAANSPARLGEGFDIAAHSQSFHELAMIWEGTAKPSYWIYDRQDLALISVAQIGVLASLLASSDVRLFLYHLFQTIFGHPGHS